MLHALIMAGGGGTRFWPRSRQKRPKQFLTLTGDRTLLQATLDRIEAQVSPERTWVLTADRHRAEAIRQLDRLPPERIVGEPCGRDTAACVGLAAALVARRDPQAVMLIMSADHLIEPAQEFRRTVQAAEQLALENPRALLTFGIPPTYPATGYGYIRRGPELARRQGVAVFQVREFKEKPDAETAEEFLVSGEYYWNSGNFAWTAAALRAELERQRPALFAGLERIADAWDTPRRDEVFRREYERAERKSIDYAVMEHAREVLVMQTTYRWDDVGSWLALERLYAQDADGNTVLATHEGLRTTGCVIVGDPGRLIATVGVSNLLIVQDGDATLIADRRDEGTVKQLVEKIQQAGLGEYL